MKKFLTGLGLSFFGLMAVGPLLWVIFTSFKPSDEIFISPFKPPTRIAWENYHNAMSEAHIGLYVRNSLFATVLTLLILLPVAAMAAYVLAKYPFRGSKLVQTLFTAGMMFPNFLAVVPLYMLMGRLGMLNSLTGLVVVYVAYSLSFSIFVLQGFFAQLPDELAEAATIDGCGPHATFWKVMLPLAKPGIVVTGIFNAIGLWNEYNLAKVLLQGDLQTLPLGLANLAMNQQYKNDMGALFAALTITMIPLLILYWLVKDRIQEAMLAGSIK